VNLFDSAGNRVTGVSFGASTTGFTFDNAAGPGSGDLPLPSVSMLSAVGVNGAFLAADGIETGSPGTISSAVNQPPAAVALNNRVESIIENAATDSLVRVADIAVTDDGLGVNNLSLAGADAAFFEISGNGLFIKSGTVIDFEAKAIYNLAVQVDDPVVGDSPDATVDYSLTVIDIPNEAPPPLIISEVTPWSSGNTVYGADWFEITNTGTEAIDITGWKVDDSSNAFATAVLLRGITSIAPGKSVVFIESDVLGNADAALFAAFSTAWFGSGTAPAQLLLGAYGGSGIGLSTSGDAVNLFDSAGNRVTGVSFGASTTGFTFDNAAGLGRAAPPLPLIATLSVAGVNGAFLAADGLETGSPGTIAHNDPPVAAADAVTATEDTALTFSVLTNDTDANGDALTVIANTAPGNGTLVHNGNGSFTYTPALNFNGADSFSYTVSDGKGGGAAAGMVHITVNAINDAPVLTVPGAQTTAEDVPVVIEGISVSDVDAGEGTGGLRITLSVSSGRLRLSPDITGGLVADQINGNGTRTVVLQGPAAAVNATFAAGVRYTGRVNFHGVDTLTIEAGDMGNTGGGGAGTDAAWIAIRVLSPAEQIAGLRSMVEDLYDDGAILRRHATLLLKTLGLAQSAVRFGLPRLGYAAIVAFRHEVSALLKPEQAQPLLAASEPLLHSLEVGAWPPHWLRWFYSHWC
jgi:hypothetical protein